MKIVLNVIIALILITIGVLLPYYFTPALHWSVSHTFLGWVTSSVVIRLITMCCVIIAFKLIVVAIGNKKKSRDWIAILSGAIIGFGISFSLAPIYDIDYGLLDDNRKIDRIQGLPGATAGTYKPYNGYRVLAFLEVGCTFCEFACNKLAINQNKGQRIPTDLFFRNDLEDIQHFLRENNGENLNFHNITSEDEYLFYSGYEFPSIYLVNPEGETVNHWIGERMNYSALDYLLSLD